jgi:hypothetical protein
MLTVDALADDGEAVWLESWGGNVETILRIDIFLFLALMKPLAQVRRFLGRQFSLPLPPNFQTRFLIPANLKEKCDHVFNI